MDTSIYVPTQTSPMTQPINSSRSSDNQPVNFGPVLWDVLDHVGSAIGGATYLIGTFFEFVYFLQSIHLVLALIFICRTVPSRSDELQHPARSRSAVRRC